MGAALPLVGVGAVLIEDGRVLLIRRGKEPLKGRWSLPGGTVERGETLAGALSREMLEETALEVEVGPLITAFERIEHRDGDLLYHYVILDYLCERKSGTATAGSDAEAVAWAGLDELPGFGLHEKALEVIEAGFALARQAAPASRNG